MSLRTSSLRFSILIAALISSAEIASAQPTMSIGKHDAYATTREGAGRITWYTRDQNGGGVRLSFEEKSFVSFKIGNRIYTNNDSPPAGTMPLPYGTLKRRGPAGPGTDTITCTWAGVDGIDIMQDMWAIGVAEETPNPHCQIGVRYRFRNKGGGLVEIATQFLLDVLVKDKDNAKTLTRHGYKRSWISYGRGEQDPLPPFFINFQNDLPNAPSYDPGYSGQGFFDNAAFGIKPPYRVTVGHWPTLERIPWGLPQSFPQEEIGDNAILMEWDVTSISPGDSSIGPSFTYGTGDYFTCNGKLFALLFYPKKLQYNPTTDRYTPNPFTLDAYIFNPEKNLSASAVSLKLDVGPNLTIVGASNPKSQQVTPNPGTIDAEGVTIHSWQIRADLNRPCSEPLVTYMDLSAASSLGPPAFFECHPEIILPCTEQDILPPFFGDLVGLEADTVRSFTITDNRPQDKGLQKIDYVVTIGDPTNFKVEFDAPVNCPRLAVPVKITQLDSTKGGCLDFTFTDCAGNESKRELCFNVHEVAEAIDSLPPVFALIERVGSDNGSDCNALRDSIILTEDRTSDKGLMSLVLTPGYPVQNMRLVSDPVVANAIGHRFSVEVIDRFQDGQISVTATDAAVIPNSASTEYKYCTIKDTLAPAVRISILRNNEWTVTVDELRPWDRLIDEIFVTSQINVTLIPGPTAATTRGLSTFSFIVRITDTTRNAGWCIQAKDLAGNITVLACNSSDPPKDVWPPNIGITPPLSTNPWKISVNINDVHYLNKDTVNGLIPFDSGIEEIWFTVVPPGSMTVGTAARRFSPTVMQVPIFEIFVTDTLDAVNTTACVTISARDSAKQVTSVTWCYPIQADIFAPVITGVAASTVDVDLTVTDDQLQDRGLRRIELLQPDNYQAFTPIVVSGDKSQDVKLRVADPNKSAFGRLQAMDLWGSNATRPDIKDSHTAYVDIGMWVQDFTMKKSYLIEKSGQFALPVTLVKNDSFSVSRKGINKYEFNFRITGDPAVTFVRPEIVGSMSATWNVNPISTNGGRDVTIQGVAPTGMVLDGATTDTVLWLIFNGLESDDTKSAQIEMMPTLGKFVVFNDDQQSIVTGPNATAIIPAPRGSITGSSVVVAGLCAPVINAGESSGQGSFISLAPISPNPISSSATAHFSMGSDAPASLKLYNSLGDAILTIAEGDMKMGDHQQHFEISGIASGTYYLRLESQGRVVTRTVKIAR